MVDLRKLSADDDVISWVIDQNNISHVLIDNSKLLKNRLAHL